MPVGMTEDVGEYLIYPYFSNSYLRRPCFFQDLSQLEFADSMQRSNYIRDELGSLVTQRKDTIMADSTVQLRIGEHVLIPIVQGGMGIGISAHRLAGAVARENGFGTIASADLRQLHPDLLAESKVDPSEEKYNRLNHLALDREIKWALSESEGRGLIAVNVMKAVKDHVALVRQACESGAHAIVMGAGLPLDLPEWVKDFPKVKIMPILSEARGVGLILKRWMKKNRLPDAIVIENPQFAAGHLGATAMSEIDHPKFEFKRVLSDLFELIKQMGLERERLPIIVAGGLADSSKVREAIEDWGASGVQIGSAFAVTQEGDADVRFKQHLLNSTAEDAVEFMSVAGLPARGVRSQFLTQYLKREQRLQANAKADPRRCVQGMNCLSVCGLNCSSHDLT